MKTYKVKGLLTNEGIMPNACITIDANGIINSIDPVSEEVDFDLDVIALPGFQNAHSHAFQYAMAGLAERHATNQTPDDFWSWRDAMYKLALTISPDDLENIAAMLYSEMLRHGYTNVAEFHYVHHDKNGKKFRNLSEMSERLVAAAKRVGIGITLVPIFYQKGGFGKAPTQGQRRFISKDIDAYLDLLDASQVSIRLYEHANLAIGIHSMRGVEAEVIRQVAINGSQKMPFHIHISEQLKEIADSVAYLGKRPVEWMLDNAEMNDRFHLVHATHLTDAETDGIAKSGANVVLCPSTEGNLGDGIFPLKRFQAQGGKWSIGTDSHIGINPFEELRLLDYGQRLISHKRNTFYSSEQGDGGLYAYDQVIKAGRKAMNNFNADYFKVGEAFNAVLIDAKAPLLASSSFENLPSTILYCSDVSMQYGTISHGELVVKEGKHCQEEEIRADFAKTMKSLGSR
jgi:formiminoglutamate deiminase